MGGSFLSTRHSPPRARLFLFSGQLLPWVQPCLNHPPQQQLCYFSCCLVTSLSSDCFIYLFLAVVIFLSIILHYWVWGGTWENSLQIQKLKIESFVFWARREAARSGSGLSWSRSNRSTKHVGSKRAVPRDGSTGKGEGVQTQCNSGLRAVGVGPTPCLTNPAFSTTVSLAPLLEDHDNQSHRENTCSPSSCK